MILFSESKGCIPTRAGENLQIPKNVYVSATVSSYLDDKNLNDFYRAFTKRGRKLLLADQYKVYMSQKAESLYLNTDTEVIYIPGQCTKYLQPLNSIVMSCFKRRSEKHRIDMQLEMISNRSKNGNIKPMTRQALISIISKSWKEVPKEMVRKSFELTGVYDSDHPSFMSHQPQLKAYLRK